MSKERIVPEHHPGITIHKDAEDRNLFTEIERCATFLEQLRTELAKLEKVEPVEGYPGYPEQHKKMLRDRIAKEEKLLSTLKEQKSKLHLH